MLNFLRARLRARFGRREKLDLLALLFLGGCYSASLLQEPKPLPPGHVRGAVGADLGKISGQFVVGMRLGLAPRMELRAKVTGAQGRPGGELGVNVLALDTDLVDVMLMPSYFGYDHDDPIAEEAGPHLKGFGLPIVLSMPLDPREQFQLFVAPDFRIGKRNDDAWSAVGVHFGAAISGPRDRASFIPECALMVPVVGKNDRHAYGDERALERGLPLFQCSAGVTFGSRRH